MKAIIKCFIAGIVIIMLGAGIIVATLAANGWKFNGPKYTLNTYTAVNDNTCIEIDAGASALKTEFYDGDKVEIIYPEGSGYKTSVREADGKLKFETSIKWYAAFFSSFHAPETVIRLPEGKVFDIEIDLGAGTVTLAGGIYGEIKADVSAGTLYANGVTCTKFDCDVSAGTLNVNSLTCPVIEAEISAGKIALGVNGNISDYTIHVSVSAGSCNVSNRTGTTDKKLTVKCSAGTVEVKFTVDSSD